MPNQFKDWARIYGANKQHLQSQGRPSSFLGQIGDIPNRIHEAADASEIGVKMMRHSQLTNGAGLPATVTIDGVWQGRVLPEHVARIAGPGPGSM